MGRRLRCLVIRASICIGGTLALGAGLRTVQYVTGASLWYDELAIARNIRDRDLLTLLTAPLDYRQMAPPGFLAGAEVSSALLGLNELALRLVPFLLSIVALLLLWRIAARFVSGWPLAFVVFLFAVSPPAIFLSANVKPYSGDIFFTLLLVWAALRYTERPESVRLALAVALTGVIGVASSYPAVLTAGVIGALLAFWWWRERPPLKPLAVIGASWGLAAGFATWGAVALASEGMLGYMDDYWSRAYAPWQGGAVRSILMSPVALWHELAYWLTFSGAAILPAFLAVLGSIVLLRRHGPKGAIAVAPVIAALLGSAFHVLPIWDRLGAYAAVPLLIAAGVGAGWIIGRDRWRRVGHIALIAAAAPLVLGILVAQPPYHYQDMRPLIAELVDETRPGDAVYVTCGARHAADYYARPLGLTFVQGGCFDSPDDYAADAKSVGADRVWLLFTHRPRGEQLLAVTRSLSNGRTRLRHIEPYPVAGLGQAIAVLYQSSTPHSSLRSAE